MPVLHLLVGCNGAGKTTLYERVIGPVTHLPFINADLIAKSVYAGDEERQSYAAARLAAQAREEAMDRRASFVAETVFSHPSKLELIKRANESGYSVTLHAVMVPEELAVVRARLRHEHGGHAVPEDKVRSRYQRVWPNVQAAIALVDEAIIYDNSYAQRPFQICARYRNARLIGEAHWPNWSPLPAR